jgi:hypothetical protein
MQSRKTKIEEIFEKVLKTFKSYQTENVTENPEILNLIIGEFYDQIVGQYRPLVDTVPMITGKMAKDITPVIRGVINMLNIIREDESCREAIGKRNKLNAIMRREAIDAYKEEGFTREEAFNLVLQDIANTKILYEKLSSMSRST